MLFQGKRLFLKNVDPNYKVGPPEAPGQKGTKIQNLISAPVFSQSERLWLRTTQGLLVA